MSMDDRSKVDVLIVGAGPAGLMAANWLAHLGVSFRIVDKRGTKVYNGQADGLHGRTIEIFDSFDIAHKPLREGGSLSTVNSWNADGDGVIRRGDSIRVGVRSSAHSRFPAVALHQGHIESLLIGSIEKASGVQVERGVLPESLTIDESLVEGDTGYPIHVRLRHLTEEEATPKEATTRYNGKTINSGLFRSNMTADDTADVLRKPLPRDGYTEEVAAKYMIGCDGAHSWVRKQLGFKLEGESTDYIWGVLDATVVTDFPDARMVNTIQSADSGSILWIPREKGLLRIYIQLSKVNARHDGAKFDRSTITPELIIETGRRIMRPYKINFTTVEWWTVYQVGQRVADHFSHHDRVFLAGDAVHTHSPKAGQGMNVSMADTYNLGWKLSSVLHRTADRTLLSTYELERRQIAKDLIAFDARLSRLFSADRTPSVSPEELASVYRQNQAFMSGLGVDHLPSPITSKPPHSSLSPIPEPTLPPLASSIHVGQRLPDIPLVRQSSDSPIHIHRLLPSTGHWRLLLFPGDLALPSRAARLNALCDRLNAPDGPVRRFTPPHLPVDGVIQVLAVHAGPRAAFADHAWPPILRPYREAGEGVEARGQREGWDYEKVFADDHGTHTYREFGVGRERGAAVVVRPDAYVGWVGEVGDHRGLEGYFAGFMRAQEVAHGGARGGPVGWAGYE